MYLRAERYIGGWNHSPKQERAMFKAIVKIAELKPDDVAEDSPTATLQVTVGYWRKANAVHAWFVQHVQDGEDECNPHGVEREKLTELKVACMAVLANGNKAQEVLPPRAGFFFGGTEIDEGYLQDLRDTVAIVDRCLALPECWKFEYCSSW